MTYAEYTDYEAWSGREIPSGDRARYDLLLSIASELIADEAGWHIAPSVTETLRLDGPGGTVLNLPSKHVTNIEEIAWADRRLAEPIVYPTANYVWNKAGIVELTDSHAPWWLSWTPDDVLPGYPGWPTLVDSISVTLTHGYAEPPAPVVFAACDMVSIATALPAEIPRGVTQITTGGVNASFDFRQALGRLQMHDEQRESIRRYML